MKKQLITTWAMALLFTLITGAATTATAAEVTIPDEALEAVIHNALGLSSSEAITDTALAGITQLYAWDDSVADLTGLEYCTRLTYLDLGSNAISDLSPLENLTSLTELDLYYNELSDLSGLENLTSLTKLCL